MNQGCSLLYLLPSVLVVMVAGGTTTTNIELCHISHYEYLNVTSEFSNATRFIGSREGATTFAVRVIAVEVEKPHREFVVARCVFDSMLPVEIVDTLYREYPHRRYQSCVNEPLATFDATRIGVEPPIVRIVCMKASEEQRAVKWILACFALLIVLLIAACVG